MTNLETAINTLEHISTTSIPAAQMRRIIRETLLTLYKVRNEERAGVKQVDDMYSRGFRATYGTVVQLSKPH